jgi:hypothetical protein
MFFSWRLVACICALAVAGAELRAALPPEELAKAVKTDALSIPTPGELLAAINKQGKPNWQSQYRPPVGAAFTSRAQIALNLGGLIADGYLAVEAEDGQQVKNIGKDIVNLAKALGVAENVLSRGSSITDFAENNEWSVLKEELEATQNEVKQAMQGQADEELITLVTLGGWVRGTEVISSWIAENYSPDNARLLRQPAIVSYLRGKIDTLSPKVREEQLIKDVSKELEEIERIVSFPRDHTPTVDDVKKLASTAGALMSEIAHKERKEPKE